MSEITTDDAEVYLDKNGWPDSEFRFATVILFLEVSSSSLIRSSGI